MASTPPTFRLNVILDPADQKIVDGIAALIGERDRARDLAAALEAEVALLRPVVEAADRLDRQPSGISFHAARSLVVDLEAALAGFRAGAV